MVSNRLEDTEMKDTYGVCRYKGKLAQRKRDGVLNDVKNDGWKVGHKNSENDFKE